MRHKLFKCGDHFRGFEHANVLDKSSKYLRLKKKYINKKYLLIQQMVK